MSIVNLQTGEIFEAEIVETEVVLSADAARELTDQIRQTLRIGHDLIIQAFRGRAWSALGYQTWDAYCAGEFNEARMVRLDREQRREIVAEMKQAGMSNRAIASGIGVDYKTVMRDAQLVQDVPVEIRGIDGKTRPNLTPVNAGPRPPAAAPAPASQTPRRRPLTDVARDVGWDARKLAEKVQRLSDDDRFSANAEQVASHLRSHLTYAIEVYQDLLDRINNN